MGIADDKPWDIRKLGWSKSTGSMATDGVYMKTEHIIDGKKHYLKLSNYDSYRGIYGHESVNELIASRLGEMLGFNVPAGELKKSLVRIDGNDYEAYVFLSASYKITESRVSFENFYVDHRLSTEESPLDFCRRYSWESEIYKMFIFDYLIINRDRHGANLEVLKNSENRLSPLFDNGLSFACSCVQVGDLETFDIMADRPVNSFIGEKRLARNLALIDRKLQFNELRASTRDILFKDLTGVLHERYYDVIWDIILRRWQNVKKFRIA